MEKETQRTIVERWCTVAFEITFYWYSYSTVHNIASKNKKWGNTKRKTNYFAFCGFFGGFLIDDAFDGIFFFFVFVSSPFFFLRASTVQK